MKNAMLSIGIVAAVAFGSVACTEQATMANDLPQVAEPIVSNAPAVVPETEVGQQTKQALIEAIADERRAQAEYEAVIAKFGNVRPYSNIVNAERRHESFLLPLFEKYKIPVPANDYAKEKVTVSATLAEACKESVKGEERNIAMYDRFLEFVKEPDIRQTFTYLRDASKDNHLPAFQRCGGGRGPGQGRGRWNE